MTLKPIDKALYRKTLSKVMGGLAFILIASSIGIGQLFILMFGDGSGENFKFNLYGVVVSLLLTLGVLNILKRYPIMDDVLYVWHLKQALNKIYNKLNKIQIAAAENDINAMTIMQYYFEASIQVYNLDDNTLTMSTLVADQEKLKQRIKDNNLTISINDYEESLLKNY
jgi:hypothetical protein